jgi:hypothetical protein
MEKPTWIAVNTETGEIIAQGNTMKEVSEKAKAEGIEDLFVTKAMPEGQEMFF